MNMPLTINLNLCLITKRLNYVLIKQSKWGFTPGLSGVLLEKGQVLLIKSWIINQITWLIQTNLPSYIIIETRTSL